MVKVIDIDTLSYDDKDLIEDWFLTHDCDVESPDMIITECGSSGIGVETWATCVCGDELNLTDYSKW